jgi:hypothetical protein
VGGVKEDEMSEAREPQTDQGRWLLDHQGLVNISKPQQKSYRGDEIDLRASVLTIEREAAEKALHSDHDRIRAAIQEELSVTAADDGFDAGANAAYHWVLAILEGASE